MIKEMLTVRDGKEISVAIWDDCAKIKGAAVIAHGMAEHIVRYDEFAAFLNANGIVVAGMDNRAHGQTDPEGWGSGSVEMFEDTVEDLTELIMHVKKRFRHTPVLIGHSYGSFLAQRFIQKHCSEIKGVILCGSAKMDGLMLKLASYLSNKKCKKEPDAPGDLFAAMTFKKYDKKIKDGYNGWLSREKDAVQKYNDDPACGFVCTNAFYQSFFKGLATINKINKSFSLPKGYPILIASGQRDGVGNYGKLPKKLHKFYANSGAKAVLKMYPDARHEILNETVKEQVYADFLDFIQQIS